MTEIQGKSNLVRVNARFELARVRVIGSSRKIAESKVKNSFYCTVSILITFNHDRIVEMLSENSKILKKIINQNVK